MNRRQLYWLRNRAASRCIQSSLRGSMLLLWLLASCAGAINSPTSHNTPTTKPVTPFVTHIPTLPSPPTVGSGTIQHYEYVFPDGAMDVYDMDHGQALVQRIALPTTAGVRGVVASPVTHMLYVSYGSDRGAGGSLLEYDLLAQGIVWQKTYGHGIDSMAITPDGKTIYMPDGELSGDGKWYIVDANSGNDTGMIAAGIGPHNTLVSLNGKHVYLGSRFSPYLTVADTTTDQVIQKIGPLRGNGVRPFTITGRETLAYMSTTGFLGFQVGDIQTGKILYTVPIQGFTWNGSGASDPSHGISLSPDEKELYVLDWANSYVHVFDVSQVPASAPRQVADIKLSRSMHHNESPCAYDCLADGWLQHNRDGRFVYVGDAGDVIDTASRQVVANLDTLYNTRKMLEIDWQNGVPIFTTSRQGMGYVTASGSSTSVI
jgi:DNA-binding beta-propeller fold protein YncE